MAHQQAVSKISTLRNSHAGCNISRSWQRRSVVVGGTSVVRGSQAPDDIRLLTDAPSGFIGPLRVLEIEGKGRGVVATEAATPGQLLLCCTPLGCVTGPQQASLTVEELQVSLASNYNNKIQLWLYQLYDGSDASTHQELQFQQQVQQQQQQQQQRVEQLSNTPNQPCCLTESDAVRFSNGISSATSSNRQATGFPHNHDQQQHPAPQPPHSHRSSPHAAASPPVTDEVLQRLMDVVRYNAYGDRHDDLAAAALIGAEAVALLGLWPEFSMLNHSCVPNAINWVLPGVNRAMVVRAARHIQPGEEVTISYLGGPQLLPLDARQEALSRAFGFRCTCPRCQAEEDIPDGLAQLVQDTVSRVAQSFAPQLQRAVKSGDTSKLQEIRRQAASTMTLLYQQFRRHLVHPVLRDQLLASCYNCLEVIADADAAVGDTQAEATSLAKCLKAATAVTPGSDLHVIVASKLAAVEQQLHGNGSSQAQQAWANCFTAHHTRYGQLDADSITQLAALNRTLYV